MTKLMEIYIEDAYWIDANGKRIRIMSIDEFNRIKSRCRSNNWSNKKWIL